MRILIENFGGMVPIRDDRLLPPNMARFAANADLESGSLEPITLPALIHTFSVTTRRAVRIPDSAAPSTPVWLGFASRNARFFPGPLVNDSFRRHIWLDNNGPGAPQRLQQNSFQRIKDGNSGGNAPYLLGVPAPTAAPGVAVTGGTGPVVTRAYTYTLVNVFGEEGQPAPPTSFSGNSDGTWNLTGFALPAGVVASVRGITHFRVYRTITGSSGTAFYRVDDVAVAGSTYNDSRTDTVVAAEALFMDSILWREPEPMEGFIELPNGFFAGWSGRTVFFSEPYRPWAWPAEYVISTSYDIIAAGVSGSALILFTTSRPVVIVGNRPENMQVVESDSAEPCFFPNSAVTAPEGVYYVGRTGLFLATQSSLTNLTRNVIKQTQWQEEYQLANLSVARINDTQVIVLSAEGFGFILDLSNERTGLIRIENLKVVDSVYNDPYTGEIHAVSNNKVYRWQAPDAYKAVALWDSKEFHFAAPVNFSAMRFSLSDAALTEPAAPDTDTIITVPRPPVPGGPWLEEVALYNYCIIGGVLFNEAPPPGTPPPSDPLADGFPDWYGIQPSDNTPDLPLELPGDEIGRVEVYANGALLYSAFINRQIILANRAQRLPNGIKSDRWRFRFVMRVPLRRFVVAETGKELMEV